MKVCAQSRKVLRPPWLGPDQLEDLRSGTERQSTALRLLRVSVTHFSGSLGEGSIGRAWSWGRVFSMSKRF